MVLLCEAFRCILLAKNRGKTRASVFQIASEPEICGAREDEGVRATAHGTGATCQPLRAAQPIASSCEQL